MSTFRLITDQNIEDGCADLLPLVEEYHRNLRQKVAAPAGFTVMPRIVSHRLSALQLRDACIAAPCDYNVLIGDSIPWIYLWRDLYGHGNEAIPADGLFFTPGPLTLNPDGSMANDPGGYPQGAFSRIYYGNQYKTLNPDVKLPSLPLYRQSMQSLLDTPKNEGLFHPEVWVDDKFTDPGRSWMGDAVRAQIPDALLRDRRGMNGAWAALSNYPVMVQVSLDGGLLSGFVNIGSTLDWRQFAPKVFIQATYGSHIGQMTIANNPLVGMTTTPYTDTAFITWAGQNKISLLLDGQTVGAVQKTGNFGERYLSSIAGWCTRMLTDSQLARLAANETGGEVTEAEVKAMIAPMQSQIDDLRSWKTQAQADITTLKGTGGGGTTDVPPPPGTNYALTGTASASSTYNSDYPASSAINGDRKGIGWGHGTGGWNGKSGGVSGDWLQVTLAQARSVNRVVVVSVQDNFSAPIEPGAALVFTKYGLTDFTVQALVGGVWQPVGAVTWNNLVVREVVFPAVSATAVRIVGGKSPDGMMRVVEAEVYGP